MRHSKKRTTPKNKSILTQPDIRTLIRLLRKLIDSTASKTFTKKRSELVDCCILIIQSLEERYG